MNDRDLADLTALNISITHKAILKILWFKIHATKEALKGIQSFERFFLYIVRDIVYIFSVFQLFE